MPAFITFGRVLFAVLFIASGASKLFDITATATVIGDKVVMPAMLATYTAPYAAQLETLTGMEMKQMLAITAGVVELVGGLMVALNFGARFFALVLVLFTITATFYFHDFWNQTGPDAKNNMIHALKNLSIIGGLFVIAGIGRGPQLESGYTEA